MELLKQVDIACPYCGESQWIEIDSSAGEQSYVEDCQVCCQPIVVHVGFPDGQAGDPHVRVHAENA